MAQSDRDSRRSNRIQEMKFMKYGDVFGLYQGIRLYMVWR